MSKKQLYDETTFDSYQFAMDFKKDATERYNKANKIFVLSVIGSVAGIMGGPLFLVAVIISIICYSQIGGLKVAASWGWKLAKIGWYVVPVFPMDILVGALSFIIVVYSSLCLPAIIVFTYRKKAKKDIETANEYLTYFHSDSEECLA